MSTKAISHPHTLGVINHMLKTFQGVAKQLCTKDIPGFTVTTQVEQLEGGIDAHYFKCVLTPDGHTGIVPMFLVVFQYGNVEPGYKSEAKAQILGEKALLAVNAKPMGMVAASLNAFQEEHKNERYTTIAGDDTHYMGKALMQVRGSLAQLDKYLTGEVHYADPQDNTPSNEIVYVDMFLKDPADVDPDGVFQTKIRLVLCSPIFIVKALG